MRERTAPLVYEYLRSAKKFPTVWCPGCGNGVVMGSIVRAIHGLGIPKDRVAVVSGIGCSGRMPVYLDFHTVHTTHGRALPFATGLKLAKPELTVIVVMGDGDALAIGGNHFIHTCRRNLGLTAIVINNNIYGMTGGQYSPTTPTGYFATTATYGNIDQPFDVSSLARVAGAAFVARSTVYHINETDRFITRAIKVPGFSVVEILSNCQTYFGRMNRLGSSTDMLRWYKENTVAGTSSEKTSDGKIARGIFVDREVIGFWEEYKKIMEKAVREPSPVAEAMIRRAEYPIKRYEILLAGQGGQGLVFAGLILGEALAIYEERSVVQTQSYAPLARGGSSRSELVVADGEIDYPKVERPDLLLAMSKEAYERYAEKVTLGGLVIVDSNSVEPPYGEGHIVVPLKDLARINTGETFTASILALGLIARFTGIVALESLVSAVDARAPRGTAELNRRALEAGYIEAGKMLIHAS